MLVLSRKVEEAIIITIPDGRKIHLKVTSMRSNGKPLPETTKVRIGIDAPRDVTVHREEVQREVERGQG
jgi:carbon storage regulator CsrA